MSGRVLAVKGSRFGTESLEFGGTGFLPLFFLPCLTLLLFFRLALLFLLLLLVRTNLTQSVIQ